jgi:hypothetical protein
MELLWAAPGSVKLNPLPFLFAPGTAVVGYLFDGWNGSVMALGVWAVVVATGTAIGLSRKRHALRKTLHPVKPTSDAAPASAQPDLFEHRNQRSQGF